MPARAHNSLSKRRNPDVIDEAASTGMEIANAIFAIPSTVLEQSIRTTLEGKDALKHALNPNQDELRYELLGLAATSRNVLELARIHKWAVSRGDSELKGVVEARAKDLGLLSRLKENYPRQWNPKRTDRLARRRKKRNPESAAAHFYKKFHGRDSEEELVIETEIHEHEWLGVLGILSACVVDTPSGCRATIEFDPKDAPWLCSSEDGCQLYIEGGNQELDLKALRMDGEDWYKERMVIGKFAPPECLKCGAEIPKRGEEFAKKHCPNCGRKYVDIETADRTGEEADRSWNIGYQTEKDFDNFDEILYQHDLGAPAEGSTERKAAPVLEYDAVNKLLYIVGGQYKIELPLLETSPGIEN